MVFHTGRWQRWTGGADGNSGGLLVNGSVNARKWVRSCKKINENSLLFEVRELIYVAVGHIIALTARKPVLNERVIPQNIPPP